MSSPEKPMTDVEALTDVLAERARKSAGKEPEAEELLDYLEGRLSPEAEREMQRRLVASPEATRKLLDLADLTEAGAAAEARLGDERGAAPADLAVHAGWRDLRTRLPDHQGAPSRAGRPHRWLVALAATLFVAVVGLGSRVWQLEQGGGPDAGLQMAHVETLVLSDEALRSGEPAIQELDPGEPLLLLIPYPERCPSYSAELAGPAPGDPITVRAQRGEGGDVKVVVLRAEPGSYTLRLFGCERELSTYGFEIVPARQATSGGNEP